MAKINAGVALLRGALKKNKISQSEAERRCGLNRGAITFWLQGRQRPSLHSALQLERLFGIPVESWETDEERSEAAVPATGTEG